MAPLVSPRMGGKVITRQGFRTNQFTTPKLHLKDLWQSTTLHSDAIGENIYSQREHQRKEEDELLAKDWTDLEESIARRKEWMCRQILLKEKSTLRTRKKDLTFRSTSVLKYHLSGSWREVVTCQRGSFEGTSRDQKKDYQGDRKGPDIAIFASDAIEDFVNNPYVMKAMNVLNMKNVVIEPRVVDPALTFYGRIAELDLDILHLTSGS